MKKIANILIYDCNQFYTTGLKSWLKEWLHSQHLGVSFSHNFQHYSRVDLIFIALGELTPWRLNTIRNGSLPPHALFIITEKNHADEALPLQSIPNIGTFLARESDASVLEQHLGDASQHIRQKKNTLSASEAMISLRQQLTFRETQILRYLARGISHATVARYLHISEKTVSAHKRNIMAKLNITRTTELHYWLINEGFFSRRETYKSYSSSGHQSA